MNERYDESADAFNKFQLWTSDQCTSSSPHGFTSGACQFAGREWERIQRSRLAKPWRLDLMSIGRFLTALP
jgi:hypothetical protein